MATTRPLPPSLYHVPSTRSSNHLQKMEANEKYSLIDAPNRVPEYQRMYQRAYKQHTRIWQINPRGAKLLIPYQIALWGTFGATLYMCGRKVLGYNTWFGKN
ncbi:hypothetical protein F5X96DRAFT_674124 [Biscogniauxia mediterranea]|nr:hypothetical protein F5X96DRAFT_674124 [Biscogniauxia mediterranea]